MTEKQLSIQVKKYFDSVPGLCAIRKEQGPYSSKRGISDWIVIYKGRVACIELKVGKNNPTILQNLFLKEVNCAGGFGIVCYTLEEVCRVIRAMDVVSRRQ